MEGVMIKISRLIFTLFAYLMFNLVPFFFDLSGSLFAEPVTEANPSFDLKIKYVDTIESGIGKEKENIWIVYFNSNKNKWVSVESVTNKDGFVYFTIPYDKDIYSTLFNFGYSSAAVDKSEIEKKINGLMSQSISCLRIRSSEPPNTLELWIDESGRMSNIIGDLQLCSTLPSYGTTFKAGSSARINRLGL
jgi:hypothetical protein